MNFMAPLRRGVFLQMLPKPSAAGRRYWDWRLSGGARIARELGILTVGVVTKPFHFEGQRRMRLAEAGIHGVAHKMGRAPSKSLPRKPTLYQDNCNHVRTAPRYVIVVLSDGTASTSTA